ncbi:MAG: retroviral-like aspartic protease family protein [Proteobacteria bacterium]|nr:retroviral-like aspartic protease family protein [Pseudomonadota bacterium]
MGIPGLQGIAVGALCALFAASATAEIYQWTDASGKIHYTQDLSQVPAAKRPAARAGAAVRKTSRVQTYSTPAAPARARRRRSTGTLHIPFQRQGTLMRVDVKLNDRVTAPFLVDTGASGVSIPYAVARELGLHIGPDTKRVNVHTANGVVSQPVVMLDRIEVGDAMVEGLEANVSGSMSIGLLGGTFFNNFVYQVDAAARVITLVPNEGVRGGLSASQWADRFHYLHGLLGDLDRHLSTGQILRKSRVRELEDRREDLVAQLDELELRADRAQVPQKWRQ